MKNLFFPLFCVFLFSCAGLERFNKTFLPSKIAKPASPPEKLTWQKIKSQKGKPLEERIKDIDLFIQNHQGKDIAFSAYQLKVQLFLKNKRLKEACKAHHEAARSSYYHIRQAEAFFASAKCRFKQGDLQEALQTLDRLIQQKQESIENKRSAVRLQWSFLKDQKGRSGRKLGVLSYMLFFSSPQKKEIWQKKGVQLINSLSSSELESLSAQADKFMGFAGYLPYTAGFRHWKKREFAKAEKYFKESLSHSLPLSLKSLATRKLNLLKAISKMNPYLIGVVVPLSGRRKTLGEKVLRGLYMGLGMDKDSSWQILAMDSKGHPDVAKTRMENLFYKYHVSAFVGGLTSETAQVIAEGAESFFVPAVLFSQKSGLTLNKEFVFQNSVTAEQLLQPLAKQSYSRLKIKRVALLCPDDPYGRSYAKIFSELFQKEGGLITERAFYKPGETDFKAPVKRLLHLRLKGREREFEKLKKAYLQENPSVTERSRRLTPDNLLPAKQDFEAIFIPDSLVQAKQIANHLKYFGAKDIYLLGTNLWNPEQNFRWAKENPLVFINLPQLNAPIRKSVFYKEFFQSFGRAPGLIEQRAYNTALFLKKALKASPKSRLAFSKKLESIKEIQGSYYPILLSRDRVFHYPLNLYKGDSGAIQILDSIPAL